MITARGVAAFAALGAAAAFTWWVLQVNAPRQVREREARHEPDYHFGDPRITRFGADGTIDLALTARHAVHYPDDDTVVLDDIRVEVEDRDGATWTMRADLGSAPLQGDVVALAGAVRIARPAADGEAPVELATERATLDTRAERISTADEVLLTHGANRVRAVGLVADLRDGRITFKSQVRGTYATR